ncbi:MAG TPA: TonB-dependent receptor [Pyrinomonadaceae bacterium]|nr:TonB-dependent receptor [Pyrinomonadaceae bacterium]
MSKLKFLFLMTAAFVLLAMGTAALAQTETGQIVGKVLDPNGAAVAGAAVSIKSVETGREVTATSNEEGVYTITNLQPGLYDVTVQSGSFKPNTQRVKVTVGAKLSIDTQLALTEIAAGTINVTAGEGVEINTQNQEVSDVVSGTQIRQLPTLTRDPYNLVGLSGNVSSDDPGPAVPGVGVSGRGAGYNINGQRAASTNILLDGADNNNAYYAAVGQRIPLDSVGEFRVVTSNFSAEYGRASGGIINVVTRSGSNDFHGTGYEFNRISRLASNGFNNNANNVARGVFTRNQFGYAVGGPIKRNKLFFFNSTEWTRVRSAGEVLTVVPTSQLIAASNAATRAYFGAYTLSATPTGRVFTVGDLSGTGPNGFNLPAGNPFAALPSSLPAFQVVRFTEPIDLGGGVPQNSYSTVTRVDYNFSNSTQIYGRYALENQKFFEGTTAFSPYAGFDTGSSNFNQNALVSVTHTFSPNFVSQTKLAFNRLRNEAPYGANPIGPGLFLFPNTGTTIGGVALGFPGYWPYNPASSPAGFGGPQNMGQAYEDVNYTSGNHQFRFGGQYVYIQDNRFFGAYQNAEEILGAQGNYAQAFANFVTGNLFLFQAAVFPQGKFPGQNVTLPVGPPDFTRSNRYNEWAVYFNDAWRFTPRLTFNMGLRYEYYGVQHNKNPNLESNFYFGSGASLPEQIRNGSVQIAENSPAGGLWRPDRNNFAPRIGFAWDVFGDGRTSVRGGYGRAYERNFGNVTFNVIQNPPSYAVLALQAGVDVPTLDVTNNNFGPLAGTGVSKTLPRTSLRHVREDIVNAYAHFWSLSFEHQLGQSSVMSAEYSGSAGRSLYSIDRLNLPGSGAVYLGDASTTSRLNPQYSTINTRGNSGFSNYNGLTLGFESNNFRSLGLQFTARYTWSHAQDNLSSTFSEGSFNFNVGLTDPFNPKLDYGDSDFDVRHRFVSSLNWDIPFARHAEGLTRQLFGGWTVAGIFNARTGTPFTIYDGTNAQATAPRLVQTGPLAVNVTDTGGANVFSYIDLHGQLVGAFGNPLCGGCSDFGPYPANMTRRNQFRGPGFWNLDAAVYKNFRLSETKSIQLRGETFNLFNHANLYVVGFTNDVSNGFIPAARGVTVNGNTERRNVQLAVKFIF